jgi:pimeloyl-ACP methyl ester carboxylesterase
MPEFTTDDGARLHFVSQGNGGLPVFHLHGTGGTAGSWGEFWSHLDSTGRRLVALDLRGQGESEIGPSILNTERLARDVLQLADSLSVDQFALVGQSYGGKVAMYAAALAPRRIRGLALLGAVAPHGLALPREVVEPALARFGDPDFVREFFRPMYHVWPRAIIDQQLAEVVRTPHSVHRAVLEQGLWTDLSQETAAAAGTPALVVAGSKDPFYGPDYQRTAVVPALPGARLVTVECGHGLIFEAPEAIARHCDAFLRGLRK